MFTRLALTKSTRLPGSESQRQVERFFGFVTEDLLRRSDHRSVEFESDIRKWVSEWNTSPTPFIWTKTAEQVIELISRLLNRISGAGH